MILKINRFEDTLTACLCTDNLIWKDEYMRKTRGYFKLGVTLVAEKAQLSIGRTRKIMENYGFCKKILRDKHGTPSFALDCGQIRRYCKNKSHYDILDDGDVGKVILALNMCYMSKYCKDCYARTYGMKTLDELCERYQLTRDDIIRSVLELRENPDKYTNPTELPDMFGFTFKGDTYVTEEQTVHATP